MPTLTPISFRIPALLMGFCLLADVLLFRGLTGRADARERLFRGLVITFAAVWVGAILALPHLGEGALVDGMLVDLWLVTGFVHKKRVR